MTTDLQKRAAAHLGALSDVLEPGLLRDFLAAVSEDVELHDNAIDLGAKLMRSLDQLVGQVQYQLDIPETVSGRAVHDLADSLAGNGLTATELVQTVWCSSACTSRSTSWRRAHKRSARRPATGQESASWQPVTTTSLRERSRSGCPTQVRRRTGGYGSDDYHPARAGIGRRPPVCPGARPRGVSARSDGDTVSYTLKSWTSNNLTVVGSLANLREALDLVAMRDPERWEVWRGSQRVAMGGVSV